MATFTVPLPELDPDTRSQLEYSLSFVSEAVVTCRIDPHTSTIEVETGPEGDADLALRDIRELVTRYTSREFGLTKTVEFSTQRQVPAIDAWSGLLDRRWVTPVGDGHVILRGTAAQIVSFIDRKIDSIFVTAFRAERELYPSTILCTTLDKIHHFTSFPEHVDFVGHLKRDLQVIDAFANECKQSGWTPQANRGRMGDHEWAICPSCCYHCYEGMEGWDLTSRNRCVTTRLTCHRYEGTNHRTLSRLRSFTQRDIIWVGTPRYVIESRAASEQLLLEWVRSWGLAGTFETANDMFFTDDFAVKASFQRQQQAKKELRLAIPQEQQAISVSSSNFHAMTFGKAFNIRASGRPATSGCIGFGYERWLYAIVSQFGLEPEGWPEPLRGEFCRYVQAEQT